MEVVLGENIPITEENFPDEMFRKFLRTISADGKVLDKKTIDKTTKMVIRDYGEGYDKIQTLKGIEVFKNLAEFSWMVNPLEPVSENDYKDVSSLTELENLQYVQVAMVQIKELNTQKWGKMLELDITGTGLKSIDLAPMKNIEAFWAGRNKALSRLNFSQNKALQFIDVSHTGIKTLNLRECKNLLEISANKVAVKKLDLRRNRKLQSLRINGSEIEEVLFPSKFHTLLHLFVQNSKLTSLDIRHCWGLVNLNFKNTLIKEIDLSGCVTLKELDVSNTEIKEIDISNCLCLTHFKCKNTKISKLDIAKNKKLKKLVISGSSIRELLAGEEQLQSLFQY